MKFKIYRWVPLLFGVIFTINFIESFAEKSPQESPQNSASQNNATCSYGNEVAVCETYGQSYLNNHQTFLNVKEYYDPIKAIRDEKISRYNEILDAIALDKSAKSKIDVVAYNYCKGTVGLTGVSYLCIAPDNITLGSTKGLAYYTLLAAVDTIPCAKILTTAANFAITQTQESSLKASITFVRSSTGVKVNPIAQGICEKSPEPLLKECAKNLLRNGKDWLKPTVQSTTSALTLTKNCFKFDPYTAVIDAAVTIGKGLLEMQGNCPNPGIWYSTNNLVLGTAAPLFPPACGANGKLAKMSSNLSKLIAVNEVAAAALAVQLETERPLFEKVEKEFRAAEAADKLADRLFQECQDNQVEEALKTLKFSYYQNACSNPVPKPLPTPVELEVDPDDPSLCGRGAAGDPNGWQCGWRGRTSGPKNCGICPTGYHCNGIVDNSEKTPFKGVTPPIGRCSIDEILPRSLVCREFDVCQSSYSLTSQNWSATFDPADGHKIECFNYQKRTADTNFYKKTLCDCHPDQCDNSSQPPPVTGPTKKLTVRFTRSSIPGIAKIVDLSPLPAGKNASGLNCGTLCSANISPGSVVTFKVVATAGMQASASLVPTCWGATSIGVANQPYAYQLTMPKSDLTIDCQFSQQYAFHIATLDDFGNGTERGMVSSSAGQSGINNGCRLGPTNVGSNSTKCHGSVVHGTSQSFFAFPDPGYEVVWSGDCKPGSGATFQSANSDPNGECNLASVSRVLNVSASFRPINSQSNGNSYCSSSPEPNLVLSLTCGAADLRAADKIGNRNIVCDHSGLSHDLDVIGNVSLENGTCVFNGGSLRVADHADFSLGSGPFTIRFRAKGDNGNIIAKRTDSTYAGFLITNYTLFATSDQSTWGISTGTGYWDSSQWHEYVFGRDNLGNIRTYVDGALQVETPGFKNFDIVDNNQPLRIGASNDEGLEAFSGTLDDLKLYKGRFVAP